MEEQKHILDILIEKVSEKLDSNVKVYLAMDDEERELLAIKTEKEEN